MGILYIKMEKQICVRCGKNLGLENFQGIKTCNKCKEYKENYRDTYRKEINEKARDRYREHGRIITEEERQRRNEYKRQVITCDVCNCSFTQGKLWEHRKTKKHQRNMERNNEEIQ